MTATAPAPRRIDYDRMQRTLPRQKAGMTRLRKRIAAGTTGDRDATAAQVGSFLSSVAGVWDEIGAWPDDWHAFRNFGLDHGIDMERL